MSYKENLMLIGILLILVLSTAAVKSIGAEGSVGYKIKLISDNGTDTGEKNIIRANITSFVGTVVVIDESGKLTEHAIEQYRNEMQLSEDAPVKEETVKKVFERKAANYPNYERLKNMTTEAPAQHREVLIEELVDMDENFTDKFGEDYQRDPAIREQVRNYIDVVSSNQPVRPTVTRDFVRDLLTRRMEIKDFIVSILS